MLYLLQGPDWEFKTGLPSWAKEEEEHDEEVTQPLITEKLTQ